MSAPPSSRSCLVSLIMPPRDLNVRGPQTTRSCTSQGLTMRTVGLSSEPLKFTARHGIQGTGEDVGTHHADLSRRDDHGHPSVHEEAPLNLWWTIRGSGKRFIRH
ncbi:hypothetical protein VTI74DRAFT_4254 [Chaetomium olivicolor]